MLGKLKFYRKVAHSSCLFLRAYSKLSQSSKTTNRAFKVASTNEKNISLLYLINDPAQKIIEIEPSQTKLHKTV